MPQGRNKQYRDGVRFEREVMELFRQAGYEVTRSAGSHGTWDFTALKRTRTKEREVRVLVLGQCKYREKGDA